MTPEQATELLAAIPLMTPSEKLRTLNAVRRASVMDYAYRPVEYARARLKADLTPDQCEALKAIHEPPYKVALQAGHGVGKTHLGGVLTNYWFDSFNPGAVITTAPKLESVKGLLWKEIRLQRLRAGLSNDFIGPSAPRMETSPDHYAVGTVANTGEGFQGRHDLRMLFLFDEAIAVPPIYYQVTTTMFKPENGHAWVLFFNPTDPTSEAYRQVQGGGWRVIKLSCMDHPNVLAQLKGEPAPIPAAVSISQIDSWVKQWCLPVGDHADETYGETAAFQWPPVDSLYPHQGFDGRKGIWWKPGPEMESRCFGLWPSAGTMGVWSEWLWKCVTEDPNPERRRRISLADIPEMGVDVARGASDRADWTCKHIRWGNTSVHHESNHGWRTNQTVGRIKQLCDVYAEKLNVLRRKVQMVEIGPKDIPIKIDDGGIGGGVTDPLMADGYKTVPIVSQSQAYASHRYPDRRSELWFQAAAKALDNGVWLGLLPKDVQDRIGLQCRAPKWKMDGAGRREVEPKEKTKGTLGRSPDDADAFNLAYLDGWQMFEVAPIIPEQKRVWTPQTARESAAKKRGLFGR